MATNRNIASPNYPVALREYSQKWQDQFLGTLRLFSNSVANAVNAPTIFGSFYDTQTQTAAVINTAYGMLLRTVGDAYGVKIGSPASRVYVSDTGVYNIQFSAQMDNTSGGSHLAWIWLRVNGIDVPFSASQVRMKGTDGELVASWNFVYKLSANDYFEIMWSVSDTAVQLSAAAAGTPYPAIPSVILTVTWVSNIPV